MLILFGFIFLFCRINIKIKISYFYFNNLSDKFLIHFNIYFKFQDHYLNKFIEIFTINLEEHNIKFFKKYCNLLV
jgi:hypothetical protein